MEIDVDKVIKKGIGRIPLVRDKSVFSASDAGQCLRYLYYSYKFPKEEREEKLKIYALGNKVHDLVKEAFANYNKIYGDFKELYFEYPLEIALNSYKIKGRADIVIKTFSNELIIIELKSSSDISKISEPEESHIWQTMLYMKGINANKGIIVYIEKSNLKIKQFSVSFNETIYENIVKRYEKLNSYLREEKLPPAEFYFDNEKSWMCKTCMYREECFSEIAIEQGKLNQ
ncbi:MAG: PD-(D/E)XK nuclease family protein [Candidatus Parvarchaeota archaeon]|nr:PD-(D/E)XK nuclease family protein [Candidatus Rehaiarchaeum fermentans]